MDITELMVYDWARLRYTDPTKGEMVKDFQVTSITTESPWNHRAVWCKDGNMGHEHIEPILMTSAILEKNGWDIEHACYANYKLPDEFSSLEFYFYESRLRKWWEGVDEWDNHNKVRDTTFQCHCTYVHQLQQALRLCGLTELANSFKV